MLHTSQSGQQSEDVGQGSRDKASLAVENLSAARRRLALMKTFPFNRTDSSVGVQAPWGKPQTGTLLCSHEEALAGHVLGERYKFEYLDQKLKQVKVIHGALRMLTYSPAYNGTSRFGCVDVDGGKDHTYPLKDSFGAAIRIFRGLQALGLKCHLEKSGGGEGWHIWVFFSEPVAAGVVRDLLLTAVPNDLMLEKGGFADVKKSRGVEVFPKQTKIASDGFGNGVYLPYFHALKDGRACFYDVLEDGSVQERIPDRFEFNDGEVVRAILERNLHGDRAAAPAVHVRRVGQQAAAPRSEARKAALAALNLVDVYGDLLVGEANGNGWIPCRDPESPTGDQNPSAGVADGSGAAERACFHTFLTGETISVFEFLVRSGRAPDLAAAFRMVSDLTGVDLPVEEHREPELPVIRLGTRQLRDIIVEAWEALKKKNQKNPEVFSRLGALARISSNGAKDVISAMSEATMFGQLIRCADWETVSNKGAAPGKPMDEIPRDMLAYPDRALPEVESVVAIPVFAANGELVQKAGYNATAKVWLDLPKNLEVGSVPLEPSLLDVEAAKNLLLNEALSDFPFATQEDAANRQIPGDRTHLIAAVITYVVRRMIEGPTPLFLIEASSPGSGKGLLASLVSVILTGETAAATTLPSDGNETRKKITSLLNGSPDYILFDNVNEIDSADLAAALTTAVWTDRLLTVSRVVSLPNKTLWLATGNNVQLSFEMVRRCVRIRLVAREERPWERDQFRHSDLVAWAKKHRGQLLQAVYTIVQAWVAAGRPAGKVRLGSFESWAEVVGGILGNAGIEGFLLNRNELYDSADDEQDRWVGFVKQWHETYCERWVSATMLAFPATISGIVEEDRGSGSVSAIKVGKAVKAMRGRIFGAFRIEQGRNTDGNSNQYRLVAVSKR